MLSLDNPSIVKPRQRGATFIERGDKKNQSTEISSNFFVLAKDIWG